jgi:hypothetical protein
MSSLSSSSTSGVKFEPAVPEIAVMLFGSIVVIAAVAAPLLVYSLTLAMFGAAHVLSELRYVDRRFGRGLGLPYAAVMGALLAGAVAAG